MFTNNIDDNQTERREDADFQYDRQDELAYSGKDSELNTQIHDEMEDGSVLDQAESITAANEI